MYNRFVMMLWAFYGPLRKLLWPFAQIDMVIYALLVYNYVGVNKRIRLMRLTVANLSCSLFD